MARIVVDLSEESTLCGDLSVHILDVIRGLKPGDLVEVKTKLPRSDVEDSLSLLEAAGVAEVREVVEEDNSLRVVLVVKRVDV